MIIRVFRPTIHPGKEHEFEAFLGDTAVPLVSQQAGLVAQHVGRPRDPSSTEYVYVTVWEDVESIRAFAGERWQEADAKLSQTHTYCRQAHRRSLPSRSTSTNSSTS